jgi:endonuclease/exonuclease/phosphatase (EEP) superfamily protein YafD
MELALRIFFGFWAGLAIAGTLLSFVRHPHWLFRIWDFPRLQLAAGAGIGGLGYGAATFASSPGELAMLAAAAATCAFQAAKIVPYSPLWRRQVLPADGGTYPDDQATVSLLVSNVLMENQDHGRLLAAIDHHAPDLVLALEVDDAWDAALARLAAAYPHAVRIPLPNYYGMVLYSRLPLVDPEIRWLVQPDIPSIHTGVRLRDGTVVRLHGIHPRPPEPIRDQSSAPRDAELVLVGRQVGEARRGPTIVAGDLNDVAWSRTSELFLRLSGLLDPRVGRGLYNSYNAKNPLLRYPLDHVFHSNDFRLVALARLPGIGSDHFPILIALQHRPEAAADQPEPEASEGDRAEARDKLSPPLT